MITRRVAILSSAAATLLPWHAEARAGSGLPFKLFDAHAHLRSEDQSRYPRVVNPPGAASPSGPPNGGANSETPQVDRVLRWMDECGVAAGAAVQHRATYGYDNSYILECSDLHPDRLAPVTVLNAEDPATPALIRELARHHGLAGVRLTGPRAVSGSYPWLDSTQALETWSVINELGLVMDLMFLPPGNSPPALAELLPLVPRFPKARVVLDHVAWPDPAGAPDYGIDKAHRELAAHRNIYYKFTTINIDRLAAANLPAADTLRHVVDIYGADHVLWGSDIGNSAGTYAEMVHKIVVAAARLTAAEQQQVLHDTGSAVYARGGFIARG
jgi:predicted TIM-barrel fold metal-dependent hydrolase